MVGGSGSFGRAGRNKRAEHAQDEASSRSESRRNSEGGFSEANGPLADRAGACHRRTPKTHQRDRFGQARHHSRYRSAAGALFQDVRRVFPGLADRLRVDAAPPRDRRQAQGDQAKGGMRAQPASAARIRAQLRVPLWKLVRSYFSFGECTRSSSSAKPTMIVSMPSSRLKSATMGIEPPSPTVTAFLPHSAASAARALTSAG